MLFKAVSFWVSPCRFDSQDPLLRAPRGRGRAARLGGVTAGLVGGFPPVPVVLTVAPRENRAPAPRPKEHPSPPARPRGSTRSRRPSTPATSIVRVASCSRSTARRGSCSRRTSARRLPARCTRPRAAGGAGSRQGARPARDHGLAARPVDSPATPTGSGSLPPADRRRDGGAPADGRRPPATPGASVRTAGVHRTDYLPLLLELDAAWDVRPFPSTGARTSPERRPPRRRGAGLRRRRARASRRPLDGRPRLPLRQPPPRRLDVDGRPHRPRRGWTPGHLGTPNRGAFRLPLTLTGVEKLVQSLAQIDVEHRLHELLAILADVPRALPDAAVAARRPRRRPPGLFDAPTWGTSACISAPRSRARAVPGTSTRSSTPTASSTWPAPTGTPFKSRIRVGSRANLRSGDARRRRPRTPRSRAARGCPHVLGLRQFTASLARRSPACSTRSPTCFSAGRRRCSSG